MHIIIIGAGLMGVTSAFALRRQGHDVTVLERKPGPGLETSFANGSLLTPSMCDPWNAPGSWRVLLGSLGRSDAPLQLRLMAAPGLAAWSLAFLRNANPSAFEQNALNNLRLSLYSLQSLQKLRADLHLNYAQACRGTLRTFRDHSAFDNACGLADQRLRHGVRYRALSRAETIELEPALAPIAPRLAGALHYPGDESGDAHLFCTALAQLASREGVFFHFNASVTSIDVQNGRVAAVRAEGQALVADAYVIAAGAFSAPLLRRARVKLPVRPAKGYSISIPLEGALETLRVPVVDDTLHAAMTPVNGVLRVAGTAEFAGFDLTIRPERVANLLALVRDMLPEAELALDKAKPWCGLRPMSCDGVPIIGPTPIANLWVNAGHGHLGWTMAAGSADLLSQLMSGLTPALDPKPYALARFA